MGRPPALPGGLGDRLAGQERALRVQASRPTATVVQPVAVPTPPDAAPPLIVPVRVERAAASIGTTDAPVAGQSLITPAGYTGAVLHLTGWAATSGGPGRLSARAAVTGPSPLAESGPAGDGWAATGGGASAPCALAATLTGLSGGDQITLSIHAWTDTGWSLTAAVALVGLITWTP